MKKIFTLSLLILLSGITHAQLLVQYKACLSCDTTSIGQNSNTIYHYGAVSAYQAVKIADDYGPRIDGDKWHGGIDFNSNSDASGDDDRGDLIIAIETGQIRGELNQGYKRLFVDGTHNFGYGHLFWGSQGNTQSGGCFLREILPSGSNDWAIVIILNGDTTAIGPVTGDLIFAGDTLTVRDSIMAGEPIGPTGSSKGSDNNPGDLGPHLHLYSNPDGSSSTNDEITKNPLQYVEYADTTFEVKILKQNDEDEGITLVYPGTNSTPIQVRPILRGQPTQAKRYPKVLDVDQVEMYIQPVGATNYERIQGPSFESNLCLGGRIGGPERYPRNADAPDNQNNSPWYNTETQWNRTGVHPYAYRGDLTNANPWDDFYYADFITRIHRNDPMDGDTTPTMIANCPQNARYNDGRYQLKAVVKDVRYDEDADDADDHIFEGPRNDDDELAPLEFVLDNFKPFIESIEVSFGSKVIYNMHWDCADDCDGMRAGVSPVSNEPLTYTDVFLNPMLVKITTSEPLTDIHLAIKSYGIEIDSNAILQIPDHGGINGTREWQFGVLLSDYVLHGIPTGMTEDIQLSFTGHDLHEVNQTSNELLNMSDYWFAEGEQEQGTSQG